MQMQGIRDPGCAAKKPLKGPTGRNVLICRFPSMNQEQIYIGEKKTLNFLFFIHPIISYHFLPVAAQGGLFVSWLKQRNN